MSKKREDFEKEYDEKYKGAKNKQFEPIDTNEQEDFEKEYDEKYKGAKNKQIELIDTNEQKAIDKIRQEGAIAIEDAEHAYDDQINLANVQRIVDERKVAETMANYGLTDSGLNRTQQTAVQLGYSNAVAQMKIQRQKQVDALARSIEEQVGTVRTEAANQRNTLETEYEANRNAYGIDSYNQQEQAKMEYANNMAKARGELAEKMISADNDQQRMLYLNNYFAQYPDDEVVKATYGTVTKGEDGKDYYVPNFKGAVGTVSTQNTSSLAKSVEKIWTSSSSWVEKEEQLHNLMGINDSSDPAFFKPRLQLLEMGITDENGKSAQAIQSDMDALVEDYGDAIFDTDEWDRISHLFDYENGRLVYIPDKARTISNGTLTYPDENGTKHTVRGIGRDVSEDDALRGKVDDEVINQLIARFKTDEDDFMEKRKNYKEAGWSVSYIDQKMSEYFGEELWGIIADYLNKNKGGDYNVSIEETDDGGVHGGTIDDNAKVRVQVGDGERFEEKEIGTLYDELVKKFTGKGIGKTDAKKMAKEILKAYGK